jgi:hypothetical protein
MLDPSYDFAFENKVTGETYVIMKWPKRKRWGLCKQTSPNSYVVVADFKTDSDAEEFVNFMKSLIL